MQLGHLRWGCVTSRVRTESFVWISLKAADSDSISDLIINKTQRATSSSQKVPPGQGSIFLLLHKDLGELLFIYYTHISMGRRLFGSLLLGLGSGSESRRAQALRAPRTLVACLHKEEFAVTSQCPHTAHRRQPHAVDS